MSVTGNLIDDNKNLLNGTYVTTSDLSSYVTSSSLSSTLSSYITSSSLSSTLSSYVTTSTCNSHITNYNSLASRVTALESGSDSDVGVYTSVAYSSGVGASTSNRVSVYAPFTIFYVSGVTVTSPTTTRYLYFTNTTGSTNVLFIQFFTNSTGDSWSSASVSDTSYGPNVYAFAGRPSCNVGYSTCYLRPMTFATSATYSNNLLYFSTVYYTPTFNTYVLAMPCD